MQGGAETALTVHSAEARLDRVSHEIADVLGRNAGGGCNEAHRLTIAAVEGEGDEHLLAIVAANLEPVRAPPGVAGSSCDYCRSYASLLHKCEEPSGNFGGTSKSRTYQDPPTAQRYGLRQRIGKNGFKVSGGGGIGPRTCPAGKVSPLTCFPACRPLLSTVIRMTSRRTRPDLGLI